MFSSISSVASIWLWISFAKVNKKRFSAPQLLNQASLYRRLAPLHDYPWSPGLWHGQACWIHHRAIVDLDSDRLVETNALAVTRTIANGVKTTLFASDDNIGNRSALLPSFWGQFYSSISVKHVKEAICRVSGYIKIKDTTMVRESGTDSRGSLELSSSNIEL